MLLHTYSPISDAPLGVVHILRNQQRGEGVSKCLRLITGGGGGGGGGGVGRLLRNQNFNFYPNINLKFFI